MDDTVADFIDISNVVNVIERLGEGFWDCICRGRLDFKFDDMVEGFPSNIGRSMWGIESDGW